MVRKGRKSIVLVSTACRLTRFLTCFFFPWLLLLLLFSVLTSSSSSRWLIESNIFFMLYTLLSSLQTAFCTSNSFSLSGDALSFYELNDDASFSSSLKWISNSAIVLPKSSLPKIELLYWELDVLRWWPSMHFRCFWYKGFKFCMRCGNLAYLVFSI